ncbi:hypothetical protein [Cupriavidus necator]|uniref:hypothetical protein n=1 Tax=Cupriavidus necator TaxID=106590 RepID=UPI00339D307F
MDPLIRKLEELFSEEPIHGLLTGRYDAIHIGYRTGALGIDARESESKYLRTLSGFDAAKLAEQVHALTGIEGEFDVSVNDIKFMITESKYHAGQEYVVTRHDRMPVAHFSCRAWLSVSV